MSVATNPDSSLWVRPLSGVRRADAPVVGGKAAGLGEAIAAGHVVPPGFVLTPTAFGAVLVACNLVAPYAAALTAARKDDFEPARAVAARLLEARWPAALEDALAIAVARIAAPRVAVRSSATLEDGDASAAAGIYETRLDLTPDRVMAAANACWAASLAPRALGHALSMGQDPATGRVALVVQAMVTPEASGVAFSVDPADATRTRLRVAVIAGPGEALVQGEGGEDLALPREGRVSEAPAIARPWLEALRRAALDLEHRFGRAVDLEFAWDGRLQLLQVRPIASLPPGAHQRAAIHWSRDLAEERFPDPITPMGWSVLQGAFRTNLETLDRRFGLRARRPDEVATVIGGYVYNNRDFFAIPGSLRFRPGPHLPFVGAYLRAALKLLAPSGWSGWPLLARPKRNALGAGVRDPRFRAVAGLFEAFVFAHAREVEAAWTRDFPALLERLDALAEVRPEALDDGALQAFLDRRMAALDAYMEPDLAIYLVKSACRWLVEEIGVLVGGERDPGLLERLTGGLAANATLEMNAALEALHTAVAADTLLSTAMRLGDRGAIPGAWARSPARPARDAFLAAYGHVTLSWDVRQPPLVERPDLLDDMLLQRLRATGHAGGQADQQRQALAATREAEIQCLVDALAPAAWAPGFFRQLIETLHTFMRLDEEHHLYASRALPTDRRVLAEIARRLVARGAIATPDDIFFLAIDEARAALREPEPHSRRRLVERRRVAFERAIATRPVDTYLGDLPLAATASVPGTDGQLAGKPASPGVAEGRVRVVSSLEDMAAFQPGEILVAPTPKPSYTPLFAVAAGLVTSRGSTLSHGLVTAREYGLPAVTEVRDACQRLRTGQVVRIDGAAGTVTLLDAAATSRRAP